MTPPGVGEKGIAPDPPQGPRTLRAVQPAEADPALRTLEHPPHGHVEQGVHNAGPEPYTLGLGGNVGERLHRVVDVGVRIRHADTDGTQKPLKYSYRGVAEPLHLLGCVGYFLRGCVSPRMRQCDADLHAPPHLVTDEDALSVPLKPTDSNLRGSWSAPATLRLVLHRLPPRCAAPSAPHVQPECLGAGCR